MHTDLERVDQVKELIEQAHATFGRIDILVNNGGICPLGGVEEIDPVEWDRVLNVNLRAVFLASQAVTPIMMSQKSGVIVNIASVAGKTGGLAVGAHYSASKAGVISLTKTFARALAPAKVRVNCVAPGPVDSPMTKAMPVEAREAMSAPCPLGEMARPEDIAEAILFLVSDGARHITGEILDVNGGIFMD